jgi:hypothetical protein
MTPYGTWGLNNPIPTPWGAMRHASHASASAPALLEAAARWRRAVTVRDARTKAILPESAR